MEPLGEHLGSDATTRPELQTVDTISILVVGSTHLIKSLRPIDESPLQHAACQPSGNGISGQTAALSLAARGGGWMRSEGWAKKSS